MGKKKKAAEPKAVKTTKEAAAPVESKKDSTMVYKHVDVDFWKTSAHKEEIGFHKDLKYSAKSRYFTDDYEIEGVIVVDGDESKKHIVAYHKVAWDKKEPIDRALKVRTFTSMKDDKGGNFTGGVELSITDSIIQSFYIRDDPGIVLIVNLPNTKNLIRVARAHKLKGWKFAFPLIPGKSGESIRVFEINGKVGFGLDFTVDEKNQKVADIDGKKLNIGGKWEIDIYDEALSKDKIFVDTLTMFACACKFLEDAEKIVKKIFKDFDDPKSDFKFIPDPQELDLFKNPRRLKG